MTSEKRDKLGWFLSVGLLAAVVVITILDPFDLSSSSWRLSDRAVDVILGVAAIYVLVIIAGTLKELLKTVKRIESGLHKRREE